MPERKRRQPKGVVDTSVVLAGLAGFKAPKIEPANPSAKFLREWVERRHFTLLFTEQILAEYRTVLERLNVQRSLIGRVINTVRKQGEKVIVWSMGMVPISPDPGDEIFCACSEQGLADFIVTLNPRDFPQSRLSAHVIDPADKIPTTRRGKRLFE